MIDNTKQHKMTYLCRDVAHKHTHNPLGYVLLCGVRGVFRKREFSGSHHLFSDGNY